MPDDMLRLKRYTPERVIIAMLVGGNTVVMLPKWEFMKVAMDEIVRKLSRYGVKGGKSLTHQSITVEDGGRGTVRFVTGSHADDRYKIMSLEVHHAFYYGDKGILNLLAVEELEIRLTRDGRWPS